MSSIYNKSNVEIKAKELLHSLQKACPDSVWQELNLQLGEDFKGSGSTNKLFSPKVLIISLVVIGAITVVLLKVTGNLDFSSKTQNTFVTPVPKPVPPPVKRETPPPPKPVVIDSTRIKDSLAKVKRAQDSIAKVAQQQLKQPPTLVPTASKIDSVALKKYYARIEARRRRRDSIAALQKANEKHDTAIHPRRHHVRDSVISIKTDTVH